MSNLTYFRVCAIWVKKNCEGQQTGTYKLQRRGSAAAVTLQPQDAMMMKVSTLNGVKEQLPWSIK